jgi:hypothetical protein
MSQAFCDEDADENSPEVSQHITIRVYILTVHVWGAAAMNEDFSAESQVMLGAYRSVFQC